MQPEPPRHDTSWTIGHLIVHQRVERPYTPVLVTLRFLTDHRTGVNYVAAVLETPTTATKVRDLCNIARTCLERRCSLRRDAQTFERDQPVPLRHGDGLVFDIHPPIVLLHFGDEQVVTPQWYTVDTDMAPEGFEAAPNLAAQSDFTIELFEHWDVHARVAPAGFERLMRLPTWCLHGDRLRMNDEVRSVCFAEIFIRGRAIFVEPGWTCWTLTLKSSIPSCGIHLAVNTMLHLSISSCIKPFKPPIAPT